MEKTTGGKTTRYLYEGDKVVLETDAKGAETAYQGYGTNLLTRRVKGEKTEQYYYLYNAHGDVTGLLDKKGTLAATYDYDAFGTVLSQTGDADNNITYAGYQYDKESGLYYLNARYYDSVTARFITEDTYSGERNDPLSLNLYTYCVNNPIVYEDPSGHIPALFQPSYVEPILKGLKILGEVFLGIVVGETISNISKSKVSTRTNTSSITPAPAPVDPSLSSQTGVNNSKSSTSTIEKGRVNTKVVDQPVPGNPPKRETSTAGSVPSNGVKGKVDSAPQQKEKGEEKTEGAEKTKFPDTPEEMDELLGQDGKEIPDGPNTQGRNKVKWKLPDGTEVTYEQHPYDVGAPEYHTEPHYHVSIPGEKPHITFRPGDQIPFMK